MSVLDVRKRYVFIFVNAKIGPYRHYLAEMPQCRFLDSVILNIRPHVL